MAIIKPYLRVAFFIISPQLKIFNVVSASFDVFGTRSVGTRKPDFLKKSGFL